MQQKRGAWQVEQEGSSRNSRIQVEQLASRDQAWRMACYYAEAAQVDVFLYLAGDVAQTKQFRRKPKRRR